MRPGWQASWQVGVSEDDDAVVGHHAFVGAGTGDIAAVGRAMSVTITLPGFIDATISSVSSRGAGLPGIRAVVMTMSTSLACSA